MSLLKRIKIGGLVTANNVFLAPLAGMGDNTYRIIGRRYGAGLTFSEMVSAHGIVQRNGKTLEMLQVTSEERPVGIQLFGADPSVMEQAVRTCADYSIDLIDINGGCSVRKVLRTGAGAGVLADPERFYRIVKACTEVSAYPVSVKLRLGLSEDRINVVENALAAQEAGAALLTLHPRTAAIGYGGAARWEYIAKVKQELRIPVCGNGDIKKPSDAVRMIQETACDAVMIGRAAIGNPWLIGDIVRVFGAYPEPVECVQPTVEERIERALEHLELVISFKGEPRGIDAVKRHMYRYLKGMRDASKLREHIYRMRSADELRRKISSLASPL